MPGKHTKPRPARILRGLRLDSARKAASQKDGTHKQGKENKTAIAQHGNHTFSRNERDGRLNKKFKGCLYLWDELMKSSWAHRSLFKHFLDKNLRDFGVKLCPRVLPDLFHRGLLAQGLAVCPPGDHGVIGVGDRDDP